MVRLSQLKPGDLLSVWNVYHTTDGRPVRKYVRCVVFMQETGHDASFISTQGLFLISVRSFKALVARGILKVEVAVDDSVE